MYVNAKWDSGLRAYDPGVSDPYRQANAAVRARFGGDAARAGSYFRRYVAFVDAVSPPAARILDAGCGSGWSTLLLRELGHDAVGSDLHEGLQKGALEVDVPYVQGDLTALPLEEASFDVVAMHQVLEHVREPERALGECLRVLRPGGRLIVVGPNLVSLPLALRSLAWNARRLRRDPDTPRHPYGNTLGEALASAARVAAHTARGLLVRRPRFVARRPDPQPPFHADNDATWLCNPMDVRAWGRANGLREVRWWSQDRTGARLWWPVAAGTWVVLEKRS
jgi:SAM-dependent methyltransferase